MRFLRNASYVPDNALGNSYFEGYLDTSDEWISQRTGIKNRYFTVDESTDEMAYKACEKLRLTKFEKEEIELLIVATSTSTTVFPNTSSLVHKKLGLKENCFCLDINLACSGYVAAMRVADSMLSKGQKGLLIGVEAMSKILDLNDRQTVILFGDGAGCSLIEGTSEKDVFDGGTRGGEEIFYSNLPICGEAGKMEMKGKEVYRFAIDVLMQTIENQLEKSNLTVDDIDWFILHQANRRIIEAVGKKLGIESSKLFMNMEKYGNTSAASVAIAIAEIDEKGLLKRGQKVIVAGFGAGLAWQSALLTW